MRVSVAVIGAYGFLWGFAAMTTAGLYALGLGFHDAETGAAIMAFLLFPAVLLWVFAARSLKFAGFVVVGGAVFMVGCALALQHQLLI